MEEGPSTLSKDPRVTRGPSAETNVDLAVADRGHVAVGEQPAVHRYFVGDGAARGSQRRTLCSPARIADNYTLTGSNNSVRRIHVDLSRIEVINY